MNETIILVTGLSIEIKRYLKREEKYNGKGMGY